MPVTAGYLVVYSVKLRIHEASILKVVRIVKQLPSRHLLGL